MIFLLPPCNHLPLTDKLHWSKTRAKFDAATARAIPSNAIGIQVENVGATFETIADEMNGEKINQKMYEKILETMNDKIRNKTKNVPCGTKPPRQFIGGIESNDATVGSAVKKNNEYKMGPDCSSLPANVAHETDLACPEHQGRRQECQFFGTGMCIQ